jgi:hypothetical protein
MKKRIGFICSGQIRDNSLNPNQINDNVILESFKNNLLNDEFISKYDYDFFISTDYIDVDKSIKFFGDNLKNINITEDKWYLSKLTNPINDFDYYFNRFIELTKNYKNFILHEHSMFQYYRMYSAYMMLKDYQIKENIHYDYFVRIRPDIRIMQDINFIFNLLENTNLKIVLEHEQLCILKPDLEEMFDLVKHYGEFNQTAVPSNRVYMQFYNTKMGLSKDFPIEYKNHENFLNDTLIRFSPEKQFVDHIYNLMKIKNLNPESSYLGIVYPSYNIIYSNKKYKYIDDSHPIYSDVNYVWKPYNENSYLKSLCYG